LGLIFFCDNQDAVIRILIFKKEYSMKTPTITVYSKATGQPVIVNPDDFDKSLYSESEHKQSVSKSEQKQSASKPEPAAPEQEKIAEPETKTRNTGRKKTAGEDSLLE
jgi:hypothetical protein